MAMEQGRVTEFEGKSLDQIQIEPEGRAVEILSQTDGLKETSSGEPSTIHPDAPHVGRLLIEFSSQMSMERVQKENPNVTDGGRYTPPDCRPRWKVAIIIPFRHRENHLKYWLHYLHPILRRQRIDYGIYIINQVHGPHVSVKQARWV
uniref:Galactosyltransferase N-terminal domain-containing protein n=1 Tax=Knipowitschia caucasica TaxID=637954 RepID=A0AAV2JU64_KNICA